MSIIDHQYSTSNQCKQAPVIVDNRSPVLYVKSMQASTSTSTQNKHRYINAKADKNGHQDYKKQTTINTGINYRKNFYQPITIILGRFVQTSNLVEAELFRSSSFQDLCSLRTQPRLYLIANPARLLFTRNVSKPVYHY